MTTTVAMPSDLVTDAPARPGFWRRFRDNRAATAALVVLVLLVAASLAAPLIAPYSPEAVDVPRRLSLSTPDHWLGTDGLGRDTLSRLLYAGRVSLLAAALAVTLATVVGVPLGVLAGYVGGTTDWLLGRAGDVLMTFPAIVLAIAIIAATGPGLQNAMIALGVVYAPRLFRVARAATLQVRAETYVEASISIGTPALRVIRRRVLPNIASPVLVQVSVMLAAALLAEAALSLLGLGVVPPTPSWGVMLGSGFKEIRSTPLLVFWPGMMIAVATLAFNLLGDGVRDAMGRRSRKAGS
jgi:peptide/nickel transport system permease protein